MYVAGIAKIAIANDGGIPTFRYGLNLKRAYKMVRNNYLHVHSN